MGQFAGGEIDQDEAFEEVVVEDKVDIEVLALRGNAVLSGNQGESPDQSQHVGLEFGDDDLLQPRFVKFMSIVETEKLQYIGVFDEIASCRFKRRGFLRYLIVERRLVTV